MQIIGEDQSASLQYVMDYSPYQLEEVDVAIATAEDDKDMNEDAETEKEQMSELKRFYSEKFEGNVLREFYPEGALKSCLLYTSGKRPPSAAPFAIVMEAPMSTHELICLLYTSRCV